MADKLDKSNLQTLFEGIRDERRLQANTANRIGNAFLSLLHFCADETSDRYLNLGIAAGIDLPSLAVVQPGDEVTELCTRLELRHLLGDESTKEGNHALGCIVMLAVEIPV